MGYSLTKRNPLYELIADYTVSGSAITSNTFSGLNITKDDDYVLVCDFYNPTGTTNNIKLYANNNVTDGNYYTEKYQAGGTTINAYRETAPQLNAVITGQKAFGITRIKLTNSGYYVTQTSHHYDYSNPSADLYLMQKYTTSTFTMDSITSLTVSGTTSAGLGIGTRFQLYRIRPASKIADVTIGSATTSYTFDLSATPIGKGSEFMLVSDIVNASPSNSSNSLYANGNVILTNYYAQELVASGVGIGATRYNSDYYDYAFANSKSFSISNIKLTNNAYFTKQTNSIIQYNSSSMFLQNKYSTSTFTATSVTSLTISGTATNVLGIGTRFQLYRLK